MLALLLHASALVPEALPLPLPMLAGTNLGGKTLARCYKASCDGWSALDFHRQVDELGSLLLVGAAAIFNYSCDDEIILK